MEMCVPPLEPARAFFLNVVFTLASRDCTGLVPLPPKNWHGGARVDGGYPCGQHLAYARRARLSEAAVNPYMETSCPFEYVRAPHTVRFADRSFHFGGTN